MSYFTSEIRDIYGLDNDGMREYVSELFRSPNLPIQSRYARASFTIEQKFRLHGNQSLKRRYTIAT